MGLCLSAANVLLASTDWAGYWDFTVAILMAAGGLGFLIFVHELGHFAVAKWCGVKCDKFMIGFDIGGYKISRKWGETVYGIGILPLGGYVKMMGQDDDPRVSTEEIQQSLATDETVATKEITGPDGKKYQVDQRSYLAKSVPQRMAIISAGVIMNIIFAFIFAVIAFGGRGVPSLTCSIGAAVPGSPAWTNGLRPGDRITRIGDLEDPWFDQLRGEVALAKTGEALNVEVEKNDGTIDKLTLTPDRSGQLPAIGFTSTLELKLNDREPVISDSPASKVENDLIPGSTIVAAAGQPINTYAEWQATLVANVGEPLEVTFHPPVKGDEKQTADYTVTLPAGKRMTLGFAVEAGAVAAIEKNSPAAAAGLKAGDRIVAVDGQPLTTVDDGSEAMNPLDLPEYCRRQAEAEADVQLEVVRDGGSANEVINVTPRKVQWIDDLVSLDDPLSIPALGVAFKLTPKVASITSGSPAAVAKVQVGDTIESVKFVAPKGEKLPLSTDTIDFTKYPQAWTLVSDAIQSLPAGTKLEVSLRRGGNEQPLEVTLQPTEEAAAFVVKRGLILQPLKKDRFGRTFSEQVSMGAEETLNALTSVYRFLARLSGGDISPRMMGGPITIARGAAHFAMNGWGTFLLFLTLISANLAVVNFLPIPVLDGGHMVFLIYEGITGRPAPEKLVTVLSLFGLFLILTLMIWVFGLDLGLISRE